MTDPQSSADKADTDEFESTSAVTQTPVDPNKTQSDADKADADAFEDSH